MFASTLLPSLPLYAFAISLVGYCFGRLVLAWITIGSSQSNLRAQLAKTAAEVVDASRAADEERFELEKRAFFSKVSLRSPAGSASCYSPAGNARNDSMVVVALRVPPKQIHQAWRLPYFLLRRHPILHSTWTRSEAPSISQCLQASCIHRCQKELRHDEILLLQIPGLAVRRHRQPNQGTKV
jgi:hypothetical protein